MLARTVRQVMDLYPRLFFACHVRHVADPKTRRVLSAHQARILDHLDAVEPTSLTDLAHHSGVTLGTMSIAVDRLVRKGYVLRARDPVDGRRVHLRLSVAGTRIQEAQTFLDAARVKRVLARLSEGERQDAVKGLDLLARASREEMEAGGFGSSLRRNA